MTYPYTVKIDGVYYPAYTEIPAPDPASEAPQEEAKPDVDGMTVKELKVYAKTHNIDIGGLSVKSDILAVIKKG